jgi:hypothetical protein
MVRIRLKCKSAEPVAKVKTEADEEDYENRNVRKNTKYLTLMKCMKGK